MEMRDDEVGVVRCTSTASVARTEPGQAADGKQADEAEGVKHRGLEVIDPLYSVAVQLKTLIAEGTATRKLSSEKTMPAYIDWPATNMWCPQTRKPRIAMAMLAQATHL